MKFMKQVMVMTVPFINYVDFEIRGQIPLNQTAKPTDMINLDYDNPRRADIYLRKSTLESYDSWF